MGFPAQDFKPRYRSATGAIHPAVDWEKISPTYSTNENDKRPFEKEPIPE